MKSVQIEDGEYELAQYFSSHLKKKILYFSEIKLEPWIKIVINSLNNCFAYFWSCIEPESKANVICSLLWHCEFILLILDFDVYVIVVCLSVTCEALCGVWRGWHRGPDEGPGQRLSFTCGHPRTSCGHAWEGKDWTGTLQVGQVMQIPNQIIV